jgi:hypothetical protein
MYKVTVELAEPTTVTTTEQVIRQFKFQLHILPPQILLAIAKFVVISLGAIIIGIVCGFVSAFITKHTERLRGRLKLLFKKS